MTELNAGRWGVAFVSGYGSAEETGQIDHGTQIGTLRDICELTISGKPEFTLGWEARWIGGYQARTPSVTGEA